MICDSLQLVIFQEVVYPLKSEIWLFVLIKLEIFDIRGFDIVYIELR